MLSYEMLMLIVIQHLRVNKLKRNTTAVMAQAESAKRRIELEKELSEHVPSFAVAE